MKVVDLLETNEWSNTEITQSDYRKHLKKKQLSACHRFVITAQQVGFYQSDKIDVQNIFKTLCIFKASDCELMLKNITEYPKLIKSFEDMMKAKQNFEQAGGTYKHESI